MKSLESFIVRNCMNLSLRPDGMLAVYTISWAGIPPTVLEFELIKLKSENVCLSTSIPAFAYSSSSFDTETFPVLTILNNAIPAGELHLTMLFELWLCDSSFIQEE